MRRRIFAVLLAGGALLLACGCGRKTEETDGALETQAHIELELSEETEGSSRETEEQTEPSASGENEDGTSGENEDGTSGESEDDTSGENEDGISGKSEDSTSGENGDGTFGEAAAGAVSADPYPGRYMALDTGETGLEIQKNGDGTYAVHISVYRLADMDDGIGRVTDRGMEFSATAPDGREITGTIEIELESGTAVVRFDSLVWSTYSEVSEYQYDRLSDAS